MKNSCKYIKLGDICEKITKGTTPSTYGYPFISSGVNYIKAESITKEGRINPSSFVYISEEAHQKLKRSQIKLNDVLFTMAGIFLGKVAILKDKSMLPANTNQAVAIIRISYRCANPFYVYYFLQQDSITRYVNSSTGQSAQPNINLNEISNLRIRLPSIDIQNCIVNILRSLDDKIELNNKINRNLEAQAQAIFKSWFIDFEPFKNGKFIDSELGKIPEGWSVSKLTNSLNIKYGKNLPQSKLTKTGYPVYGANGQIGFFPQIMYKKPQVLISCRGAASGKVITSEKNSFITNNSLILDYSDTTIPFSFVKYWALSTDFSPYVSGSAQPQITIDSLSTMNLTIPDEIILKKFNNIVIPILDKIFSNNAEIIRLSQLRDILLPRLLSGEINISDYIA